LKKTLVLILALPLCIAFIMSVFAKSKPTRMILTGEVVRIDEMAQTISVKAAEDIEVFDVADTISNEDYDLRPGDVVEIEYNVSSHPAAGALRGFLLPSGIPSVSISCNAPHDLPLTGKGWPYVSGHILGYVGIVCQIFQTMGHDLLMNPPGLVLKGSRPAKGERWNEICFFVSNPHQ